MAALQPADPINCLGPLGHGFSLTAKKPLLVGGGMGIAPLLFLAKTFAGKASILMGGRNAEEMFWPELYQGLVQDVFITTDDGSMGTKGFTVTLLPALLQKGAYDRIFVCGPEIMMRGVAGIAKEAGIALTPAGASFPRGTDPDDTNIRLAPSFPPLSEVRTAMAGVATCVALAAAEQMSSRH